MEQMDEEFEQRLQKELKDKYYKDHRKFHKKHYFYGIRIDKKQKCTKYHKICYSKKEANEILNHPIRLKKIPVRMYLCDYCGAYHTTSKKGKKS